MLKTAFRIWNFKILRRKYRGNTSNHQLQRYIWGCNRHQDKKAACELTEYICMFAKRLISEKYKVPTQLNYTYNSMENLGERSK